MKPLVAALREIWGLFVEDASFTGAIAGCVALAMFVFPQPWLTPLLRGPLLFAALALVLLENSYRSARKSR